MNAVTQHPVIGIRDGQPNEEYHSGPGISKSNLDLIHEAPALLEWSRNAPRDPDAKAAVDVGTAFHAKLLEPETFDALYVVEFAAPPGAIVTVDDLKTALTKRGAEFKASASKAVLTAALLEIDPNAPVTDAMEREWRAGVKGRTILSRADITKVMLMRDSVMAHPEARRLIEADGTTERSYYWVDGLTGELCRARHDKAIPSLNLTADVKTTADIGRFARSVAEYRYHVQDAWYRDGHHAVTGEALSGFPFIVVSTTRDRGIYPVRVFNLIAEHVQIGRDEYRADLETYAECRRTGAWRGAQDLALPAWYVAQSQPDQVLTSGMFSGWAH